MAFAKYMDVFFAVRTFQIAHVLHYAQNGDIHLLCHINSLCHDHAYQLLRRGNDDNSVYRKRLENRQRHVAGSRRHIHKHIVHVLPQGFRPELLYSACDHRASPDHGICGVWQT